MEISPASYVTHFHLWATVTPVGPSKLEGTFTGDLLVPNPVILRTRGINVMWRMVISVFPWLVGQVKEHAESQFLRLFTWNLEWSENSGTEEFFAYSYPEIWELSTASVSSVSPSFWVFTDDIVAATIATNKSGIGWGIEINWEQEKNFYSSMFLAGWLFPMERLNSWEHCSA